MGRFSKNGEMSKFEKKCQNSRKLAKDGRRFLRLFLGSSFLISSFENDESILNGRGSFSRFPIFSFNPEPPSPKKEKPRIHDFP